MWYLTSETDQRVLYLTPHKRELSIGRSPDQQVCDFAIQDDASISRKHAVLILTDSGLFVKDLGSRYGTFLNNSEIVESNTTARLFNNCTVKFGKMKSIWTVHEAEFVTCTSTLKGENLQNLKLNLTQIGAVLKNDWDNTCNYLTMPTITLTIKVVLALLQGSYIVSTQFWAECLKAIGNNKQLPDPKDYRPNIVESTLNKEIVSFMPDNRRASLFAGKKFVFFSKRQFELYKSVLITGSATPLLLSECKLPKQTLTGDDVIVIQYNMMTTTSQETGLHRNQITEIVNYLKRNGKRVVADPEIGLAILHCSTAKYCNPSFNFSSEVVKQTSAPQSSKVLAQETQESHDVLIKKENVVINESLLSNDNSTNDGNTSKRKLNEINEDDLQTNANKKFATNLFGNKTNNDTNKRKHGEGDDNSHPSKKMAVDIEEDFFNFITSDTESANKTSKLNLAKPQKRKADLQNDEDDLFNFVQNKKLDDTEKEGMLEDDKEETVPHKNARVVVTAEEISAMRGAKLEELKNSKVDWSNVKNINIKKEYDDIDTKMNRLDIGEVIITIKDTLIIKKEPIETEASETSVKNYKKFKKVWPIKMRITVIPKSTSVTVTQNHDERENNSMNN